MIFIYIITKTEFNKRNGIEKKTCRFIIHYIFEKKLIYTTYIRECVLYIGFVQKKNNNHIGAIMIIIVIANIMFSLAMRYYYYCNYYYHYCHHDISPFPTPHSYTIYLECLQLLLFFFSYYYWGFYIIINRIVLNITTITIISDKSPAITTNTIIKTLLLCCPCLGALLSFSCLNVEINKKYTVEIRCKRRLLLSRYETP